MPTAGDSLEELQPYLCCLFLVTLANFQETKVRLADWASTISRLHDSIVVRVRMRSCYCFVFNNRVETAVSRGREVLDRLWAARWDWGNRHHPDGFFQLHSSASPRHRSTAAPQQRPEAKSLGGHD